jgi:RNA polymerase subunit RPABC4/transcription elongation factor Spt4
MARKGLTMCGACAELTPSAGGYCRLCKTPLIQAQPGPDEGHCPACGALVNLVDEVCYGCGWRLKLPLSVIVSISLSMGTLTLLSFFACMGLYARIRWG